MEIFGKRLKELREEKKLSQKNLADIFNTTNSSICDWERGRTEPNLIMLKEIAEYFEVSSDFLIGIKDD